MRRSRRQRVLLACLLPVCLLVLYHLGGAPGRAAATTVRDPLQWPFAPTSIWNMPIGANAAYVNATIGSRGFSIDTDWFVTTRASDPLVPTYAPPTFGQGRCTGTTPQQQAQWHPEAAQPLHVPSNLIIPDAITSGNIYSTPNNSSAFLEPDGKTLVSFNVTARCQAGGPLYGTWFGLSDLYGDGISGGHGGSAMSSIGGSIRAGELLNSLPIRHALKLDVWGNWLHYDHTSGGHRWPAPLADGGAPQQYKGTNPALVMGSLLALPPDVTAASLGITSASGKKVFAALQNYGAYIVDDSGGGTNNLCIEHAAASEFTAVTGHPLDQDQGFVSDFNKMIAVIKVIDNNGPNSIGGGGTPRVPLAPAFGAPIDQATATPPSSAATPTITPTAGDAPTALAIAGNATTPPAGAVPSAATRQSGNGIWLVLLINIIILAGGVGGFLWWRRSQRPALDTSRHDTMHSASVDWPPHSDWET